jgi:hypothetical protein
VRTGGLRKAGHGSEIADTQLARLEQRRDQPHTARIRENPERLCEVLEHALVREALQNGGHPLRLHALDLTAIEWDNRSERRWRSLHSREDDTEMAAEAITCRAQRSPEE